MKFLRRPPIDYARQHLEGTRDKLREAEEELQAYQQKHHLSDSPEQLRLLLTQREALDARQRQAQERAKELRSRYDSLNRRSASNLRRQSAAYATR